MIQILQSFGTSDGQLFKTVGEAQAHELELLLSKCPGIPGDFGAKSTGIVAEFLVNSGQEIIAILGGKVEPKAKPRKPRKDKGIPRKAAKKGKTGGVASHQTAPESRQDAPGGVLTP